MTISSCSFFPKVTKVESWQGSTYILGVDSGNQNQNFSLVHGRHVLCTSVDALKLSLWRLWYGSRAVFGFVFFKRRSLLPF